MKEAVQASAAETAPQAPAPVASVPVVASSSAAPDQMRARSTAAAAPAGPKKNLLTALREKYGDQYAIEEVKEAESLNLEKLRACWDAYGATLEAQQKHSA